jgi:hypothetical protein
VLNAQGDILDHEYTIAWENDVRFAQASKRWFAVRDALGVASHGVTRRSPRLRSICGMNVGAVPNRARWPSTSLITRSSLPTMSSCSARGLVVHNREVRLEELGQEGSRVPRSSPRL